MEYSEYRNNHHSVVVCIRNVYCILQQEMEDCHRPPLRLIENKYGHLNTEKQSKAYESTALHGNKTGENSPQAKFQRTLKKKNLALPRIHKT